MPSPVFPPARNYKWEQFEPANTAGQRHGAFSARTTDPIVAELVEGLLADRADLDHYPEALWAWARAEARCLLLTAWLAAPDTPQKATEGVLRHLATFENLAARLRNELGLTPSSEARLARDRADATATVFDLEGLRAAGRAALEARALPQEPPPPAHGLPAPPDPPQPVSGPYTGAGEEPGP